MAKQPPRRVRKALKKYVRGNPRVKLPANWTAAKVRVLPNGDVQVKVNPSKTGRFARGVKSVENPGEWYAIVSHGSHPSPSSGPFRSIEAAEDAAERFRERYGYLAGQYLAAGSTRIVGPFNSRIRAKAASISRDPSVKVLR